MNTTIKGATVHRYLLGLLTLVCCTGSAGNNIYAKCSSPQDAQVHVDALDLGPVHADVGLDLRIHFGPRNPNALDAHIAHMQDASHPRYGVPMTPEQYARDHGPTPEDVAAVVAHLRAQGVTDIDPPVGQSMAFRTNVKTAEKAFSVAMMQKRVAKGDVRLHPDRKATLPSHLPDVLVTGLTTRPPKINHSLIQSIARFFDLGRKRLGHAPLDAKALREVYDIPDQAGAGQSIAMVELDGYEMSDITRYFTDNELGTPKVRNVLVGGFNGRVHDQGARQEVTLDIELAGALAPAAEIVVYEADNGDHGLTDIFARLANPIHGESLIKFISCSWGEAETNMTASQAQAEYNILKQLAAQGQTVFVAAGDDGAHDDGAHLGTDDPASQPFAMAVGGTRLSSYTSQGHRVWGGETTWTGGGGGISRFWAAPPWQKGLEGVLTKGSLDCRNVPDVALNADPESGYKVYIGGYQVVGGTSCAAPLWAAFAALVDEKRALLGKPALGFLPPILYKVAQTPVGQAAMHDIEDGSDNGFYPAVDGLDAATGWGSFVGDKLIDVLSAQ